VVGSSEAASLLVIERVYRERGGSFLRLALAQTGDVESARDALQEGFARAVRSRASYRGTGPIEAWLARCVLNAARDSRRRRGEDASADDPVDPGADFHADAGSMVVREAVGRLPRRQRDTLFLRYYLDFDYSTIAEALGVEVGTVSATLHAARAALARALQEVQR
jgi:RNA polymerase sigma factor (sigma-70 family)